MHLRTLFFLAAFFALTPLSGFAAEAPAKAGLARAASAPGSAKKMEALPAGVRVLRDIEYARRGEKSLLLDLYLPEAKASKPLPVVVWVHGGGWRNGSKDRCPAVWLVSEGYAVASISYRLATEAQWPAQMDDCRAALRWLRANAAGHGLDSERVAAWGGSAGGHLAALMGTLDGEAAERVQAVVDWYGPSDLLTMPPNVITASNPREKAAQANGALLLGGVVVELPERAKSASALHQVTPDDPPFLILHGDADPQVPLEQSERLHARLRAAGVPSTLKVLPGAGHGGAAFSSEEARDAMRKFLAAHLRPAK